MENKKKTNYCCLILYVFSILVAYFSSLQSGTISSSESSWITNLFLKAIESLKFLKIEIDYPTLHNIVRKLFGHFGWFFVMGILGFFTFLFSWDVKSKGLLISFMIGIFVAITAELLQFFAEDRGPMIGDIVINFSGYVTSSLLSSIVYKQKKKQV